MHTTTEHRLRLALPADAVELAALIELSVRVLQAHDYTPLQIEGALGTVLGLDTQLIADGTYFVIEARQSGSASSWTIAGCGGWSRRKTLFGSDHRTGRDEAFLDPAADAAKIRAFFVHPKWSRRGFGSEILAACEDAARAAGFKRFELGATLTGVPLYLARGYREIERMAVPLRNGASLPVVRMGKPAGRSDLGR